MVQGTCKCCAPDETCQAGGCQPIHDAGIDLDAAADRDAALDMHVPHDTSLEASAEGPSPGDAAQGAE